jgi:hypothetical protein
MFTEITVKGSQMFTKITNQQWRNVFQWSYMAPFLIESTMLIYI